MGVMDCGGSHTVPLLSWLVARFYIGDLNHKSVFLYELYLITLLWLCFVLVGGRARIGEWVVDF